MSRLSGVLRAGSVAGLWMAGFLAVRAVVEQAAEAQQAPPAAPAIERVVAADRSAPKLAPAAGVKREIRVSATRDAGHPNWARVISEADRVAESKIEQALAAETQLEFVEAPLSEVVSFLRDQSKIQVLLDRRALEDVGIASDTPITVSLKAISLRSALRTMLRDLDLTYVVRDQVLLITTPEEAESRREMRLYQVSDLAEPVVPPFVAKANQWRQSRFDTVRELITSHIAPDSWDEVGGAGSIEPLDSWGLLAISQTRDVHEQISPLLSTIRSAMGMKPTRARQVVSLPALEEPERAAEATIRQKLENPVLIEFAEAPLSEVIDYLKIARHIPIIFDRRALDDVGVGTDTPVSISLKAIPLRSVLRLILEEFQLTYDVQHEMLVITTPAEVENRLSTRVYPVVDFLAPTKGAGATTTRGTQFDRLIGLITSSVAPDSWDEVGGPGSISAFAKGNLLVISQTSQIHDQIGNLLSTARQMLRSSPQPSAPAAADPFGSGPAHKKKPAKTSNPFGDGSDANPFGSLPSSGSHGSDDPFGAMAKSRPSPANMVLKVYATDSSTPPGELAPAIMGTVDPTSWQPMGGAGAIFAVGSKLLVRQTPQAHAKIEQLLFALNPRQLGMGGVGKVDGGGGFFGVPPAGRPTNSRSSNVP